MTKALKEVHEVLVTVEPQGPQEVPEPLATTKAAKEVHEVLVTVEPQGSEEVSEPLAATKAAKAVPEPRSMSLLSLKDLKKF